MSSVRARFSLVAALTAGPALLAAQQPLPLKHAPQPTAPAITAADLMTRLYIFADDSMMGREVGTPYHLKATAYIESEVKRLGLTPAGDNGTFFQNIPVFEHPLAAGNAITVEAKTFKGGTDYIPRDNSVFGKVKSFDGATAIFGGVYSPEGDTSTMLSPAAAAGKFVVIAVPNGPNGQPLWGNNRQQLTGFYLQSVGIAVVSLDAIDQPTRQGLVGGTESLKEEIPADAPGVPTFMYVSQAMGEALIGVPLTGLARGTPGRQLRGTVKFDEVAAPARNVVAILPGSDPKLKGQFVAIGAHNDHIGFTRMPVDHDSIRAFNTVVRPKGEDDPPREATAEENAKIRIIVDSLRKAQPARLDSIYNGADDDGSGTVSVLEIAESFIKSPTKPKRSMIFVWHAGEEKGLWGSQYFTDHPTISRDSIVAQLNIDMVGRGGVQDEKGGGPGYLQLIGSRRLSTELGDLVEAVSKTEPSPFQFDYQFDANGHPQQYYCRSDHYEYARYGIPIVFFSTGGHRDYHQLTDEPQYIDYDHMARVANLVHDIGARVANLDHRIVVDHPKPDPRAQCVQ